MKKKLPVLLVLVMLLGLCACGDESQAAETVNPACVEGHTWVDATCDAPKICAICGVTEGNALGHSWKEGVCTLCEEEKAGYDPLLDGVWFFVEKQRWSLFEFQPDGTCDVMNILGKPFADYDLETCVNTAVDSLKKQYGDDWEQQALRRFHVFKVFDYYYVAEMTARTDNYTITDDLITIGNIPPVTYLIIINDNVLESGENDNRFSRVDFTYYSNLFHQYNKVQ